MMKRFLALLRDRRGLGAVEFALVCPVLFLFIIGTAELGTLFFANAGVRNAVAEGARAAGVYPRPTDTAIKARMAAKRFGLKAQYLSQPVITTGKDNGVDYINISLTYQVPLDFVFVTVRPVTLTKSRRVYIYPS
jgi:Flp pilus assembly protein TadG